jgi:hypothetical protein
MYDIDLWYEDFPPVTDANVVALLKRDSARRIAASEVAATTT